jgi:transposase
MEALIERAAGLDVHQGSVVACVILGAAGRRPTREVRSFGTMRQDLAALRAWLLEKGVTHVGMEGTGVYWRPIHAALEGAFTLASAMPRTCATCPGAKPT